MDLKKYASNKITFDSIPQVPVLLINSLLNTLVKQRDIKCAIYLTKQGKVKLAVFSLM